MTTTERLVSCFKQVFPYLDYDTAKTASEDTLLDWDSVHVIALVITVESEFGVTIENEDLPKLTSFEMFYLLIVSRDLKKD